MLYQTALAAKLHYLCSTAVCKNFGQGEKSKDFLRVESLKVSIWAVFHHKSLIPNAANSGRFSGQKKVL